VSPCDHSAPTFHGLCATPSSGNTPECKSALQGPRTLAQCPGPFRLSGKEPHAPTAPTSKSVEAHQGTPTRLCGDLRRRLAVGSISFCCFAATAALVPLAASAAPAQRVAAASLTWTTPCSADLDVGSCERATYIAENMATQADTNNLHDDVFVLVGAVLGAALIPLIVKWFTALR
jgi:hypothetical protein